MLLLTHTLGEYGQQQSAAEQPGSHSSRGHPPSPSAIAIRRPLGQYCALVKGISLSDFSSHL